MMTDGSMQGTDGRPRRVLIAAGEHSGSVYGSLLARCLKGLDPDVHLSGVGGHPMASEGVDILYDSSSWGGIGLVEALKRSPRLYWAFLWLRRWLARERPSLVILIDYPGFNMRLARAARDLGIPTLYYIPPGKYRSPPEDVLDAVRTVTRFAAPLPVTYEKYAALQADVTFVGHPILDVLPADLGGEGAKCALGLPPDSLVIGLLPGSRMMEITYHTPVLLRAARVLAERFPGARMVMPLVDYKDPALRSRMESTVRQAIAAVGVAVDVHFDRAPEVLAASHLAIVASGTATLEAAYYATPMVIIYRTSKLTEFFVPFFHPTLRFVGLPNILADRPVVPELLQDRLTNDSLVTQAIDILTNQDRRARMKRDLLALRPQLGLPGASERVARMALAMVDDGANGGCPPPP